jgi:hypothetical protein
MALLAASVLTAIAGGQGSEAAMTVAARVDLARTTGPMEMDRFALGQGGLSDGPMWEGRAPEVRALRPRLIRLFLQEYYDLLPAPGRYHFATLDRSVDLILRSGAKPLMCIAFKPKVLFPEVNQDVVEPTDWRAWDELVYRLVRHYRERGAGITYWEVANEPDIGEDGGCPYRFQPDSYVRYYSHTAAAILSADPNARVGGPALANWRSPILPALLDAAERDHLPLHFVSWHIYSSNPGQIRQTIDGVNALLAKHPSLHVETVLDEWNMDLGTPPTDPRIQPCYVAEVAWQMREAGLDLSCYYHIRDYHVVPEQLKFMSPRGTAFMARWWNRMVQYDGLFDFQNTIRPTYFAMKLLARLTGERLTLATNDAAVHGFATYDREMGLYNVMLWNFAASPADVTLTLDSTPGDLVADPIALDATTASNDENDRLRHEAAIRLTGQRPQIRAALEPYAVRFWSIERAR